MNEIVGAESSEIEEIKEILIAALKEVPESEIDGVLNEVMKCLGEFKRWTREDLEQLLDRQYKRLEDLDFPKPIIESLKSQREGLISKVINMRFAKDNIPVLPVIPRVYILDIEAQIQKLLYKEVPGHSYLYEPRIRDLVETPEKPYYLIDVNDGTSLLGKSPFMAEKILQEHRRRGLTVAETIALCVHTDVLSRHCVDAAGSRYGQLDDLVPCMNLNTRITLRYCYILDSRRRGGTPSCSRKIFFGKQLLVNKVV